MSDVVSIVSGLPRSGTSVMMQMLDGGGLPALSDAVRTPDVDNPRGYFEFEPVKRTARDASWLEGARGRVVKMVHLLLLDLPVNQGLRYRVVMMERELDEVLASQGKMLDRLGSKGARLDPGRLKAIYVQQLAKVSEHLAAHPGTFDVLGVSYNELVGEPGRVVARVNAFLGGGLDEGKMRGAVDPSLYRNRGS